MFEYEKLYISKGEKKNQPSPIVENPGMHENKGKHFLFSLVILELGSSALGPVVLPLLIYRKLYHNQDK